MTHDSRVIPDEIRIGAQKPLSFLKFVANKSVWIVVVIIIAVTVIDWRAKRAIAKRERAAVLAISSRTDNVVSTQRKYPQFNTKYISVSKETAGLLELNVELPPSGEVVVINIPSKFYGRWGSIWSNSYPNNQNRLYKVKLNDDNNLVKTEGLLNGKMTHADFKKGIKAHKVEFESLLRDNKSTYLTVSLMKE